jgi:hypothetical protein
MVQEAKSQIQKSCIFFHFTGILSALCAAWFCGRSLVVLGSKPAENMDISLKSCVF